MKNSIGFEVYEYNKNNNLIHTICSNGVEIYYEYNEYNKLIHKITIISR